MKYIVMYADRWRNYELYASSPNSGSCGERCRKNAHKYNLEDEARAHASRMQRDNGCPYHVVEMES